MKLSELIAAYGDEKVEFQNLDHCNHSMQMNGRITKITGGRDHEKPEGAER